MSVSSPLASLVVRDLDQSLIKPLLPSAVRAAHERIAPYIHRTPLMGSALLDNWLGHEVIFKVDGFQKVGSFKIRGALNALLTLKEEERLPSRVVAFSSGNHAQAVASAGKLLGIKTTIIMPSYVSKVKQQAATSYGAELILTETRQEAEALASQKQAEGDWFLHPSADDAVIAGQGTACLESLEDGDRPDAVFASCGGGGLLSGTLLAAKLMKSESPVYGVEPAIANDAAQSWRTGHIVSFSESPMTIADGARTLHVSERTFYYLRQLAGFYEAEEDEIIYWTQWLHHLLKAVVEPTAAMAMAGAYQWLQGQKTKKRVLVILSGGNMDAATSQRVWKQSYLEHLPRL